MNSSNDINDDVDLWAIGKCVFCKGQIGEDSKILKCLHIICKDCIKRERNDSSVQCKCKIVTEGDLINYSIGPSNVSEVKICCESDCNVTAKRICIYCKTLYCKPCSKIHLSKKVDHNPELMMKYPLKSEFLSCPKCIEKCIEVYCTQCSQMTCSLCLLRFHRSHNFKFVTKMATEIQTLFNNEKNELGKNNNHLDILMQRLDEHIQKFESQKKQINDKIDAGMKLLHSEVDKRSLELKQLLEMQFMECVNSVIRNKEVINGFKKQNEYYYNFTSSIVNCNKTFEYMKLSKIVSDQMINAKSYTLHKANEMSKCKFDLEYNDQESIQKCVELIQGIGNIITSPIVGFPEIQSALNSNNTLSKDTDKNKQPSMSLTDIIVKEEITEDYSRIADSDSSDYEPLVSCACCNQWTEELISCVRCERFYHNDCHIPPLAKDLKPKDPLTALWKCTICQDITIHVKELHHMDITGHIAIGYNEKKLIERILMELYCQNEDSEHYRDCLDREIYPVYYEKINDPISLNDIKQRFENNEYSSLVDVLKDMEKVFENGKTYYSSSDPYYESAHALHISLRRMMDKWIPTFDQHRLKY